MADRLSQNESDESGVQLSQSFSITDILRPDSNRFSVLEEVGEPLDVEENGGQPVFNRADAEGWTAVQRKRQRISTGGESNDPNMFIDYEKLSADEKLSLILKTLAQNQAKMSALEDKLDTVLSISSRLHKVEDVVNAHTDRITLLEYRSIDMEARQRRNNLLFKGHPETRYENCGETILRFLSEKLGLTSTIPMERVHRLGRYTPGRQRFIIVAFRNYTDTELILSNAHKLRGSHFGISRDFPPEITEARRRLWPEYRDLQSRFPDSKIQIVYPAKIIKDGRVVKNLFPNWDTILRGSRTQHSARTHQENTRRSDLPDTARAKQNFQAGNNAGPVQDPNVNNQASGNQIHASSTDVCMDGGNAPPSESTTAKSSDTPANGVDETRQRRVARKPRSTSRRQLSHSPQSRNSSSPSRDRGRSNSPRTVHQDRPPASSSSSTHVPPPITR